jgi:hypothetical protein
MRPIGLETEWRITPEPVIGPRFARTRWAPIRPVPFWAFGGRV